MSCPANIHGIAYLRNCMNVDNMMFQFKKDRDYIISTLEGNIDRLIIDLWTPASPVCFDEKCLFNMGRTEQIYTLEERIEGKTVVNESVLNYYTCPQCTNMKRLVDFRQTEIGTPFFIECGDLAGEQLVITETYIDKLYILKESPPAAVERILANPYINSLKRCSAGCSDSSVCNVKNIIDYIGLDPFSNNMLINWYLNNKLSELDIPNVIAMHTAYVCSSKGYSLYEYPNIGRIRHLQEHPELLEHMGRPSPTATADDKVPISKDVVKGIIMQLFAVLHALKVYDFSHGGPSSRSILLKNSVCSYMYDGVHVECPITIKLCDLYHAGITVGNKRLYNKSVIADEELLKKPFKPIIDTATITPFSFDRSGDISETITIYRLKDPQKHLQESVIYLYLKYLGLPLYQSSFDAYGFMISLMADRAFYTTLMNDESCYLLWRSMWLPEEFETIQDRILKLHQSPDPVTRVDKVIRVLAGLGLRCDMIEYGWDMIKTW